MIDIVTSLLGVLLFLAFLAVAGCIAYVSVSLFVAAAIGGIILSIALFIGRLLEPKPLVSLRKARG